MQCHFCNSGQQKGITCTQCGAPLPPSQEKKPVDLLALEKLLNMQVTEHLNDGYTPAIKSIHSRGTREYGSYADLAGDSSVV